MQQQEALSGLSSAIPVGKSLVTVRTLMLSYQHDTFNQILAEGGSSCTLLHMFYLRDRTQ